VVRLLESQKIEIIKYVDY